MRCMAPCCSTFTFVDNGQRVQNGSGVGLGTQVPGLLLLGVQRRSQKGGGQTGAGQAARATASTDTPHTGPQPRTDRRGLAGLRAGLEVVLPPGADVQGHARTGSMAATPAAGRAAQAVAKRPDDLPRTAPNGRQRGRGGQHRWQCTTLVAQQRLGAEPRAYHRLLRPLGGPEILPTSTSRTARCGPACRVVSEGSGQR
jgi:hypothetical protein